MSFSFVLNVLDVDIWSVAWPDLWSYDDLHYTFIASTNICANKPCVDLCQGRGRWYRKLCAFSDLKQCWECLRSFFHLDCIDQNNEIIFFMRNSGKKGSSARMIWTNKTNVLMFFKYVTRLLPLMELMLGKRNENSSKKNTMTKRLGYLILILLKSNDSAIDRKRSLKSFFSFLSLCWSNNYGQNILNLINNSFNP